MPIRILLVEEQQLFRQCLRSLIDNQADMEVVGEAATGIEALRVARSAEPDIFLMDISLSGPDGITTTRQVLSEFPRSAVIILTYYQRADLVLAAIGAGARGYVLKSTQAETVVHAIREVAAGRTWLDPQIAGIIADTASKGRQFVQPEPVLTDREREVMTLICRGATNREISRALHLSEKTVKRHAWSLFRKLGVRSRSQVMVYAYRNGLLPVLQEGHPPPWMLASHPILAGQPAGGITGPCLSSNAQAPQPAPADPSEGGAHEGASEN